MFNSLDQEIEKSEGRESVDTNRLARYLIIVVVSALVFSGLILGIWSLG
jgi:hypothetical protein